MNNLLSKKKRVKNFILRTSYSSPTISLYRWVASTLFSLARATSNEFVSCTLRETQGCRFQVSCHYFAKQDFRPTRDVSRFPPSRARSIIASELSSKKTSFRCKRILHRLFSAEFLPAVAFLLRE